MNKENPPPYTASPPPPGMAPPPTMPYPPPTGSAYSTHTGSAYPTHTGMAYPPPPPPGVKTDFTSSPPHTDPSASVQAHVVITSGPTVVLGPAPQHMICPSCHAQITTAVSTEPNTKTHLFALLLCLFGCYLCCCIPYCVDSCQSQNHNCPNCGAFLGTYQN